MRGEHAFSDVDAQPDPSAWIRVLDTVGRDPHYAAYKRRMLDLLRPEAGGTYLEVGVGTGADAVAIADRFDVRVVVWTPPA
jgi:ubiquinone/menaquinone biosynthesis C-methylase UbiE